MSIVFGSPEANAIRQRDAALNNEPPLATEGLVKLAEELRALEADIADMYQQIDSMESVAAEIRRQLGRVHS